MVDRKVDWEYLVLAFFITVLLMTGILYLGTGLSDHKVNSLRDDVKQIEVDQRSHSLGLQLAESVEGQRCEAMRRWVDSSVPEIQNLRQEVAAYESSSKVENQGYELVKKRYMNLVIQNLIEVRQMEERCGEDKVNIVYMYTKNDCDRCEDQGTVLTYYRRNYENDVLVHPLDTDLKMKSIEFMEDFYNITDYPVLIIEGEVYEGFQNRERLGNIIEQNLNQTNQSLSG
jgi:hypothetical protein